MNLIYPLAGVLLAERSKSQLQSFSFLIFRGAGGWQSVTVGVRNTALQQSPADLRQKAEQSQPLHSFSHLFKTGFCRGLEKRVETDLNPKTEYDERDTREFFHHLSDAGDIAVGPFVF
jgi:hypothetical protein